MNKWWINDLIGEYFQLERNQEIYFKTIIFILLIKEIRNLQFIIEVIIVLFIHLPLTILIHEMGHAIGILTSSKKAEADIIFGSLSKEKKLKFKIGRVNFYVTMAFSGFCCVANIEELAPFSNRQELIIDSGGPLASLVGSILFLGSSYLFSEEYTTFLDDAAFINFIMFIINVLPYTFPSYNRHIGGYPTDGLRILNVIKEMRKNKIIN
ncbi:hypothetical protein ACFVR1_09300 [Psychrobacillus sp. NPDC058041]|uniref:hypothetical protein n=1 Tax=Psychrobacillus sp. NPDC058041 TaxID=3346310 RepID=UPI0036DAE831